MHRQATSTVLNGEGSTAGSANDTQRPPRVRPPKRKRSPAPPKGPEEEHCYTPWTKFLAGRKNYDSVNERLHFEIVAYQHYILPTEAEKTARDRVFNCIAKVLRKRFPEGEIKPFGSAPTGLCGPNGDIDIVIRTSEVNESTDKKRILFQLSGMLKNSRLTWDVQVNHRARVPIVTFDTVSDLGAFSVDVGINNVDGLAAIDVVNSYLAKMPAMRPLILVLKAFLSQRGLNNAANAGLSSYGLTCMVISFLQLNPSERPDEYFTKPLQTHSLGVLLQDFLLYYGTDFPYTTSYISVTEGKLLPKSSADWINKKVSDRLAIQCLINPENDVGKSASRLDAIRDAFKHAYADLLQLSVTDTNILKSLVSLNQVTLDRREHLRHIVESGKLDSAILDVTQPPRNRNPRYSTSSSSYSNNNNYYTPVPRPRYNSSRPAYNQNYNNNAGPRLPYGTEFGTGSSTVHRPPTDPPLHHDDQRKGSGFTSQSQNVSSDPRAHPSSKSEGRNDPAAKRRRLIDRLS